MKTPEVPSEEKKKKPLMLHEKIELEVPTSFLMSTHGNLERLLGRETLDWLNTDRLIEKVALGAAWLDSNPGIPGWEKKINLEVLSLGSTKFCILSQASGLPWGMALDRYKLSLADAISYGLHPGDPAEFTDPVCRALTIIWLTKIKINTTPIDTPPWFKGLRAFRNFFKKLFQPRASIPSGLTPQPA